MRKVGAVPYGVPLSPGQVGGGWLALVSARLSLSDVSSSVGHFLRLQPRGVRCLSVSIPQGSESLFSFPHRRLSFAADDRKKDPGAARKVFLQLG